MSHSLRIRAELKPGPKAQCLSDTKPGYPADAADSPCEDPVILYQVKSLVTLNSIGWADIPSVPLAPKHSKQNSLRFKTLIILGKNGLYQELQ